MTIKDKFIETLLISISGWTIGQVLSNVNLLFSCIAFGLTIVFTIIKIRKELKK